MAKFPLRQALRVYWLNLLVIALTPTITVMTMVLLNPLWPISFLSLAIFGIIVPYHFGKAPLSYVFTCQLVFLLGGFLVPLLFLGLWALGVPEDIINPWWPSRT
jgi:hypothetical protein